MNQSADEFEKRSITFWQFFRLIFLLFSLYFLGDVFYRWDGIKLYASFTEFFPSISLAAILWSILSILVSILIWLLLKTFQAVCQRLDWKISIEQLLFWGFIFVLIGALVWRGKNLLLPSVRTTLPVKLSVLIAVAITSIVVTWLFRKRARPWLNAVHERITPLIWLFGIFVMLSVILVAFINWGRPSNKPTAANSSQTSLSKSDKEHRNILLVTFDALTAHNMSAYGYDRLTTPFITKWAESSTLITRAKSASNLTGPTTTSLMTGKRVWTHRRFYQEKASISANYVKTSQENLASVLKKYGYRTYALAANAPARVENIGISDSFDIVPSVIELVEPDSIEGLIELNLFELFGKDFLIYNWLGQEDFIFTKLLRKFPQKVSRTEHPPEKSFNRFLKIIDDNPGGPFFAWLHIFPPHDPYLPPEPYAGTYNTSNELRERDIQFNVRVDEYNKYAFKDLPVPQEIKNKLSIMRDYYDEYILYSDKQFEEFITKLKERNMLTNTIIMLSADHGESFDFDHDYFFHSTPHLYEQVTSIPLIIREPDQNQGRIIDMLTEQIDIPATILDLANIPVPTWMEGRSILPVLRDRELPSKPIFSMHLVSNPRTEQQIKKGTIAVWDGDYKLIHYLEKGKSLLYDLGKDPDELNNIFDAEPEMAQNLLSFLNENLKRANERIMRESK